MLGPSLLQLFAQGRGFKLGHIVSAAVFDCVHIHSSEILHFVPLGLGFILLPYVPSLAPWGNGGETHVRSDSESGKRTVGILFSVPREVVPRRHLPVRKTRATASTTAFILKGVGDLKKKEEEEGWAEGRHCHGKAPHTIQARGSIV